MQKPEFREAVLYALDQVLNTRDFVIAPKMSDFLRYIVTQTLDGNASRLKAYSIAVDALGKPSSFDPQSDPSVRVLAYRVRKKLASYYKNTPDYKIEIRIKTGGYVPVFVCVSDKLPLAANEVLPVNARRDATG